MKKQFFATISSKWTVMALAAILMGTAWSCSSDDVTVPDDPVDVPTVVENPIKVVKYEASSQGQSDLDELVTYAFTLKALRQTYWNLLSGNFENPEKAFTVHPDVFENDNVQMQRFYDIVAHVSEHADQYEAALKRLSDTGILETENTTRGWLSDGLAFITGCKSTEVIGRASVMAVIRESGWATDTQMLTKLFYEIPEGNRRGYDNPLIFWNHFSRGKLDDRANVIYDALYHSENTDFGVNSMDLGLSPGKNVTKAGAMLIEKGMNLVLDASPISTQIGYGKDLFSTVEAEMQLRTNLIKYNEEKGGYEFNSDALKNYAQTYLNNLTNYGPQVLNWSKGGDFEGWDLFSSDELDRIGAFGLEALNFSINEQLFSDNLSTALDRGQGQLLVPNTVTVTASDGTKIPLTIMVDQKTGEVRVGLTYDKNGNPVINPGKEGDKFISAFTKKGGHVTKSIKVGSEPSTEEVDFEEVEEPEEEPANGRLKAIPSSFTIDNGYTYRGESFVNTNYLYYSVKSDSDWLTANLKSDGSWMTFLASTNDTGKKRKGNITIMATNKAGKVLKSINVPVTQEPYVQDKVFITATPSTVNIPGEGGSQEITLSHTESYNYLGAQVDSDLSGWGSVTPSGDGYTITAIANNTISERSGTVTFFAAVTADALDDALNGGQLNPEEVVSTTVIVKQTAGSTTIKLTPDALEFEAAASKQRVTIDGGVYKYWDAYPDENCADWVTVSLGNNWDFEVKVTANNEEDERTGTIYVLCYEDGENPEGTGKKVALTVKQEGFDLEMKAYPDFFSIPADGAVEFIKAEYPTDQFKYFGYAVQDDAKSWVKANIGKDYWSSKNRFPREVYFTVAPNETGQPRTGHIKMYLTNNSANPENERVYMNDVTITQDAGPFKTLNNIYCGSWLKDQETTEYADNTGEYWCVRLKINPDGTFKREYMFTTNGGQSGTWKTNAEGTYSVTGFTQNSLQIHVDVKLYWYNSEGEQRQETTFFERYPHFMRHGGFYLDKVEQ